MLGSGAAATTDQPETEFGDELLQRVGQFDRLERVVRAVGRQLREPGIGHAADPDLRVPGQMAQVFAHLGRTGRAVQPDQVDPERLQRRQGGADLRTEQHGAGRLDRDVHDDRQVAPGVGQGPFGAEGGGLGLQQILRRLDQHRVDAAGQHPLDLGLVGVTQLAVRDMAQGRQLRPGPDAAEHPPRAVDRAVRVRRFAGDPGRPLGQVEDLPGDAVLAERGQVGTEGVGLDRVDADLEVGVVDGPDDVGPGAVQHLVAALELVEVGHRQVVALEHRPHRPVSDHDAASKG